MARYDPPVSSCIEAGLLGAQQGVDFVLGIGGGSSLDAAKAIAVFAANPQLDEAGFYALAWERDPLPIVLVGTTAGTGSEVTKVSVLTDAARRKHSIHDDRLYATVAFGDSRHTHTCPTGVTLSCGIDDADIRGELFWYAEFSVCIEINRIHELYIRLLS